MSSTPGPAQQTGEGSVAVVEPPPAVAPAAAPERAVSPLRAGILSIAQNGFSQAIRVANHLILAKFLSADAFGLMAIVNSCTTAVELFSDVGIGQKVVQSSRGEDPTFFNTAWTL